MSALTPASASTTTSPSEGPSSSVSPFLLRLSDIESKHRKRLFKPIENFLRDTVTDVEQDTETTSLGLLDGFEDDQERRTWEEGMRYRADGGQPNTISEGKTQGDIDRATKRIMNELERRE